MGVGTRPPRARRHPAPPTAAAVGGRPLWANEAVRERFARCLLDWWRLDNLAARFADALDAPQSLATSMLLKSAVAEGLDAVLAGCVQLHGASGFTEHGLADLRAESIMFGIAGGATEAMLAGVADAADQLLGLPPAVPAPAALRVAR